MFKKFVLPFVVVFMVGCTEEQPKKKDEVFNVEIGKPAQKVVNKSIEYHGNVESPKVVQVKNRIDGFLDKQYFNDGSYVKSGQLLYKIDDKMLKTELASLTAQLKQTTLNLENLETIKKRNEKLFAANVRNQQEVEASVLAYEKEKYALEIIKANIEKVNTNISYTNITAPISWYIEKSSFNEGAFVPSSGTYLTNIYQANPLFFSALIPSQNQKFEKTTIEFDDMNISAKLSYCDPSVDLTSGLLKCRFEFTANKPIKINTLGKIKLATKTTTIFIPQKALVQSKNGKAVYLLQDGKAVLKTITIGDWDKTDIEVISGLTIDDTIITEGIANLRDNASVKVGK